jgi:AmmeMemoRadiSam system protein B
VLQLIVVSEANMTTRQARLAGMWYPADEAAARREIEGLLGPEPEEAAVVGIVPHAGWAYSGKAAALVWQAVAKTDPRPERVLLFGTHMGPATPAHVSMASSFETPLGPIRGSGTLAKRLAEELSLRPDPADGMEVDNTVEVQLPILKYLLPEAELVVVGPPASSEAIRIGEVAARVASEDEGQLAVVGSTDLTHYGPNYGWSPKGHSEDAVRWVKEENDKGLVDRLLAMDSEGVVTEGSSNRSACCPGAAAAAVAAAKVLGAEKPTLLDYYTSHDVRPDRSFVGYAGVVFGRM